MKGRLHNVFSRRRWRLIQLVTRIRRIHHPRWSFGWAFPLTAWAYFENFGWKRVERAHYHDSTTTGRY